MEIPMIFETKYHAWKLTIFYLFFCYRDNDWSDVESDLDLDNMHKHDEYSHSEIINRCNFGSRHLINAHLSSQTVIGHGIGGIHIRAKMAQLARSLSQE